MLKLKKLRSDLRRLALSEGGFEDVVFDQILKILSGIEESLVFENRLDLGKIESENDHRPVLEKKMEKFVLLIVA